MSTLPTPKGTAEGDPPVPPGQEPAFAFPAGELTALAVKVRGRAWADDLPRAWRAAHVGGWNARRTARATTDLILNGDPDALPQAIVDAARKPLEAVPLSAGERERAQQIAAEAIRDAEMARQRIRDQEAAARAGTAVSEPCPDCDGKGCYLDKTPCTSCMGSTRLPLGGAA